MPRRGRKKDFGEQRRTVQTSYRKLQCWQCDETGHTARDCTLLSDMEKLYEIDRLKPGINFKDHQYKTATVATPGTQCQDCNDSTEKIQCNCTNLKVIKTKPIKAFKDLGLGGQLYTNIVEEKRSNFKVPTPIQRYALPIIMQGFDVMGCAQTGTGKTGAYIIPMVKMIKDKGYKKQAVGRLEAQKPEVLILAPTRELAIQIHTSAMKLAVGTRSCAVKLVYGGKNKDKQCEKIRRGCNILIGTPGRVMQLISDFTISLENIKFFVLDEADKMIDMGFAPDIEVIQGEYSGMPSKAYRQTLMFSATFREDILEIAASSMKEDYRLIMAGEINSAQPDVKQDFELVESKAQKLERVEQILIDLLEPGVQTFLKHECWKKRAQDEERQRQPHPNLDDFFLHVLGNCANKFAKVLIFVETRKDAERVSERISDNLFDYFADCFDEEFPELSEDDDYCTIENFGAIYLSGKLTQKERSTNFTAFKDGVYPIMVSTNVAARGLDIQGITHVINYDLPIHLSRFAKFTEYDAKMVKEGKIKKNPERNQFEEYIHRIGRTGRAGNTGKAITFFLKGKDDHLAAPLVEMLGIALQDVPEWLEDYAEEGSARPSDRDITGQATSGILKFLSRIAAADWDDRHGPGENELWGDSSSSSSSSGPASIGIPVLA